MQPIETMYDAMNETTAKASTAFSAALEPMLMSDREW